VYRLVYKPSQFYTSLDQKSLDFHVKAIILLILHKKIKRKCFSLECQPYFNKIDFAFKIARSFLYRPILEVVSHISFPRINVFVNTFNKVVTVECQM
jgi:hypothetical protein